VARVPMLVAGARWEPVYAHNVYYVNLHLYVPLGQRRAPSEAPPSLTHIQKTAFTRRIAMELEIFEAFRAAGVPDDKARGAVARPSAI
jgi:hypothetical protein